MSRRGFTLIELLITVSIIALLSAAAVTIYSQLTMNARDARRKLDLQNISQALEDYYQKNGHYPIPNPADWRLSSYSQPWIPGLDSTYTGLLPQDPKSNGGRPWVPGGFGYAYCSGSVNCHCSSVTDGQWYILAAQLENSNDPDKMEAKHYKWCDGTDLSSSWSGNSYVVTPR